MNDTPNPEHVKLAQQLLAIAGDAMTDAETPAVDWLDDRDVAILCLISTAVALAEAIDTRDDVGDGLMSGRVCIVLDSNGGTVVERTEAA